MIATRFGELRSVLGAQPGATPAQSMVTGVSLDSRRVAPGDVFFAVRGQRVDGHAFVRDALDRGACGAVVAADAGDALAEVDPARLHVVGDVCTALGRLAGWHRRIAPAKVIAVTGSNGKTTTKDMIVHILRPGYRTVGARASFNNHWGVPLTLLACDAGDAFVVVEIGSSRAGEVAALARLAEPDIGVVTSIGSAHLGGFGDLDGVRREKLSLLAHTREAGVIPDDIAPQWLDHTACPRLVRFGRSDDADWTVDRIASDLGSVRARLNRGVEVCVPVPGAHNALNAAAAIAVTTRLQVPVSHAVTALATFAAPALRMSVERVGDVSVISDCYNANPASVRAAIDVLANAPHRRILVIGEMAELGSRAACCHQQIGQYAVSCGVDLIAAVGQPAWPCTDAADDIECVRYADNREAAARLPLRLGAGDTVLIKGSRVARMEGIADAIRSRLSNPGQPDRTTHRTADRVVPGATIGAAGGAMAGAVGRADHSAGGAHNGDP